MKPPLTQREKAWIRLFVGLVVTMCGLGGCVSTLMSPIHVLQALWLFVFVGGVVLIASGGIGLNVYSASDSDSDGPEAM
jgi:hypothetical protein